MQLSIIDRIALPVALAKGAKGSFVSLILAEGIEKAIKLTKEDLELYKIETVENGIKWDEEADKANYLDLEFDEKERELIVKGFEEIEKAGEATKDLLATYKKFMNL